MNRDALRTVLIDQKKDLLSAGADEISREQILDSHINFPEISVLTGVRRCGKSTLLRQHARRLRETCAVHYLNFEDQRLSQFGVDDFQGAYEEFLLADCQAGAKKQVLIYDEVQLVEGWERWVAGLSSRRDIKVFITGSNSSLLSSELAGLLTGRYLPLAVSPLSFAEIAGAHPQAPLHSSSARHGTEAKIARRTVFADFMRYGGFPRAYLSRSCRVLGQYHEDILIKDIAVRKKVRNLPALKALGSIMASQNGRIFSQSAIAPEIGLKSKLTMAKFCDYFKETFLYSELKLFSRSRRGQLRGRSKFYAVDPLLAAQVGYHHGDSAYWILENHVCNELLRRGYTLFYWHSRNNLEVDFIIQKRGAPTAAVQVSTDLSNPDTLMRETRALEAARRELGIRESLIITADEPEPRLVEKAGVRIAAFPDWALG